MRRICRVRSLSSLIIIYFSTIAFRFARPESNWLLTILSQFMNRLTTLLMKGEGPYIVHVTRVPCASGAKVNSTVLTPFIGLKNSSLKRRDEGGVLSRIVIVPCPVFLPSQEVFAPTPALGPSKDVLA